MKHSVHSSLHTCAVPLSLCTAPAERVACGTGRRWLFPLKIQECRLWPRGGGKEIEIATRDLESSCCTSSARRWGRDATHPLGFHPGIWDTALPQVQLLCELLGWVRRVRMCLVVVAPLGSAQDLLLKAASSKPRTRKFSAAGL